MSLNGAVNVHSAMQNHMPVSTSQKLLGNGMNEAAMSALGALPPPKQPSILENQSRTDWILSDLVEPQKGSDIIVGLITGEAANFLTDLILPWSESDSLQINWNIWKLDTKLIGRVPHKGISRLVSTERESRTAMTVRHGIGLLMELDAMRTAVGLETLMKGQMGIAQSIQETSNHDTMTELLTCKRYDQIWADLCGRGVTDVMRIVETEIEAFGCLAFGVERFEAVFSQVREMMLNDRVEPNTLIIPAGRSALILMTKENDRHHNAYYMSGPDGPERQKAVIKAGAPRRNKMNNALDIDVFETRSYSVSKTADNAPAVNLAVHRSSFGEYYVMERKTAPLHCYTTRDLDVVIDGLNENNYGIIKFKDALLKSFMFNSDGLFSDDVCRYVEGMNTSDEWMEISKYNFDGDDCGEIDDLMPKGKRYQGGRKVPKHVMPFATTDASGKWVTPTHFGKMHRGAARSDDFVKIAETIANKMDTKFDGKTAAEVWSDMILLIEQIEKQQYNEHYFKDLIRKNYHASTVNGKWTGERTPQSLTEEGLCSSVLQWKGNVHGSLDLPNWGNEKGLPRGLFPAGFANGPGFQTLADEAEHEESYWCEIGKRAACHIRLLRCILYHLNRVLLKCEVTDPCNRDPWFHKDDQIATFFSHVVSTSREPIFLAVPSAGFTRETAEAPRAQKEPYLGYESDNSTSVEKNMDNILNAVAVKADDVGIKSYDKQLPGIILALRCLGVASGSIYAKIYLIAIKSMLQTTELMKRDAGEDAARRYLMKNLFDPKFKLPYVTELISFITKYSKVGTTEKDIANKAVLVRKVLIFLGDELKEDGSNALQMVQSYAPILYSLVDSSAPQDLKASGKSLLSRANDHIKSKDLNAIDGLKYAAEITEQQERLAKRVQIHENVGEYEAFEAFIDDMIHLNRFTSLFSEIVRADNADQVQFLDVVQDFRSLPSVRALGDSTIGDLKEYLSTRGLTVTLETVDDRNVDVVVVPGESTEIFDFNDNTRFMWYRTPLTSSYALISSMLNVEKSLILPSDPATSNTTHFEANKFEESGVIDYLLMRHQYANIRAYAYECKKEIIHLRACDKYVTRRIQREKRKRSKYGGKGKKKQKGSTRFFSSSEESSDEATIASDYEDPETPRGERRWDKDTIEQGFRGDIRRPMVTPTVIDEYLPEYFDFSRGEIVHRFKFAQERVSNPIVKAITTAVLFTRCDHRNQWIRMLDNDVLVPIKIILWRLNITMNMETFILMLRGLATGTNAIGYVHGGWSVDMMTKIAYYNFTFYSKAIVKNPTNVALIPNAAPKAYLGGCNRRFVVNPSDLEDTSLERNSIIATVAPITDGEYYKMLSFTGRIPYHEQDPRVDWAGSEFYDTIFNLSDESRIDLATQTIESASDRTNVVAFQGLQFDFNSKTACFDSKTNNQGHRKNSGSGPGAVGVWNGKGGIFPEQPEMPNINA